MGEIIGWNRMETTMQSRRAAYIKGSWSYKILQYHLGGSDTKIYLQGKSSWPICTVGDVPYKCFFLWAQQEEVSMFFFHQHWGFHGTYCTQIMFQKYLIIKIHKYFTMPASYIYIYICFSTIVHGYGKPSLSDHVRFPTGCPVGKSGN